MDKSLRVCIDKVFGGSDIHQVISRFQGTAPAIAIVTAKMWQPGKTLRVRFLEGDPEVQNKVKEKANDWTNYANIKFDFVSDSNAEIQIAFQKGAGSWSAIGTDSSTANPGEATMNLGWLDANTPDKEYSRVVKHEFGHALGLIHEFEQPAVNIDWDKQAVYTALEGPPNNWSKETVDQNLFTRYSKTITQYSTFDAESIMMYPIPPEWTISHKSYGMDVFDISETDKEYIKRWYT